MADDIDIEEHDILDNPRVQNILPQISNIKTEPSDYQENYDENYCEQSEYDVGFIENLLREDEAYSQKDELPELSTSSDEADVKDTLEQPIVQPKFNRIVLGSKPCPKRKKIKHFSILLEDWSERLNTSPCYCKDCKTLFATRNALDAHNMVAHSFLVALEAPKEPPQTDNHKYCNHCQKYFQDDGLLIQHLYDLITAKQAKKDVNNTSMPIKTQTVVKQVKNNVISIGSVVPVAVENNPTNNSFGTLVICPICTCLFKSFVKCKEHCVKRHGLSKVEEKSAMFTQECKICRKKLQNLTSYNYHVKKRHPEQYLKKVVQKAEPAIPKKVLVKRAKFKCIRCDLAFNTVAAAKVHQHSKHGKLSRIVIAKLKTFKPKRYRVIDDGLVPKNVLFKCDKCPMHTMNCIVAIAHSVNVHTGKIRGLWKCDICRRNFREVDKVLHKLQHEHTKEFKVYVLHENIYSRVLCRCPKCHIYFEERLFMKHTKHLCGKTSEVEHCNICEVTVNNMPTHKKKHELRSFIKSDFIRIDDFVSQYNRHAANAGSAKRKLVEPPTTAVEAKRRKIETKDCPKETKVDDTRKYLVYYCNTCQIFINPPDTQLTKRQRYHAKQKCLANRKKFPCNLCGLVFNALRSKRTHLDTVHAHGNVGVKDCYFQRITDCQPCVPRIPELPKCHRCGVHYLTITSRHSCVLDARSVCKICKKTFDKDALKVHTLHHKYIGGMTIKEVPTKKTVKNPVKNTLKNSLKIAPKLNSLKIAPKMEDKSLDLTLKMRYQKLISTWNILYNCKMCDVTNDHYDYVVEHCQKHYNKLENYNVTIQQCEICMLRFESDCFNRHSQLHSDRTIDRNDFKILQYDWYSLLTVSWTKILDPLPKEEIHQILSRSIYVTPAVKMTLIVDGPPEYTLYECQSCAKIITSDTVIFHAKNGIKCTKNVTKFMCSICNFCFATRFARDTHASIHKKQAVTASSFRVVAFNSPQEKEFNSKLLAEHTEICKIESDAVGTQLPIDFDDALGNPHKTVFHTPNGNMFRYFQCQKCMCCVAKYQCTKTHSCSTKCIQCPKCTYLFRPVGMNAHVAKHGLHKDFTKGNIVIVPFNEGTKRRGTWKECKYCRFKYRMDVLPSHIAQVHQHSEAKPPQVAQKQEQVKDSPDTSPVLSITLFRCRSCKCLFLNKQDLTNHQKGCNPNNFEGATCDKCGLVFHRDSLYEHSLRCIQQEGAPRTNGPVRVYKCEKCNVYFTHRLDAKKHLDGNHQNYTEGPIKQCFVCGWRFHDFALLIHIYHHHKKIGMKVTDLVVVTIDKRNVAKKIITRKYASPVLRKVDDGKTSVASDAHDVSNDAVVPLASVKPVKMPKTKKQHISEYNRYRNMPNTAKVLFKCKRCDLHYIHIDSWISHCMALHVVSRPPCNCPMCGLLFPCVTFLKHKRLHHKITKDALDPDVEIIVPEEYFNTKLPADIKKIEDTPPKIVEATEKMSHQRVKKAKRVPATEIVDVTETIDVSDVSQSSIVEATTPEGSTDKTVSKTPKEHSHKIYKCGQCNVYFMAQSTCYIHMLHHTPMDPKEYIECKLCNLPFKIMSLNIHIRKHHKGDFNLEEVLVEEYSNDGGKTPKIDIYYAAHKLQFRLVSTTTIEPVSQSSQLIDSGKDVKEMEKNIKSIDDQVYSCDAGSANDFTTLKATNTSSKNFTNEPTTPNADKETNSKEAETEVTQLILHECSYCDEKFKSNTSKEFHESLDHLDGVKDCQFCKESFNLSILNEIHLSIKGDTFKCCLCSGRYKVWDMLEHSYAHNIV